MAFIGTPLDTRNTFQSLVGKRFSGDASTTAFTLDVAPSSTLDIEVFVGNVRQDPNSAYTLSGTTLTFTGAPPSGTNNIYVVHQAKSVGTIDPPAGASIDMNGVELILDADADTSITADTDDQIDFKVGGTDVMSIDSTGAVTKSLQPAFLAIRSTGNQSNLSNGDTITFDTETFDLNADFASYTFTAPITGKYQFGFIVSVQSLDYNATFNRVELVSSNKTFNFGITSQQMFDDDDPTYFSFQGSLLIDMDASDTCKLQWGQSGGSDQADTFDSTYFSGYLVC
jgi:hypothetical protein|tara:strand:+ start:591 stop:1442 length:852 start_codon:yes stop_codon:yes gene_type:complete